MTLNERRDDESGEQGWALARLITIHDGMRNDLALLRRAVTAVTDDDRDVEVATSALGRLSFKDPGWSLQRYCAGFCGFVHDHHSVEDARLFPTLIERQGSNDAEFQSVLEKLVSDHRALTGHLDDVKRALKALPGDAEEGAAATRAIERLSQLLEEHLKFEEANLAPALNALSRAVPEDEFPAPSGALQSPEMMRSDPR